MLRRRRDRLSERAWQRLHLGLAGGDPAGQVACAWSIAQDLMDSYQHTDPAVARRHAADRLITDARACPVPEIARIGCTLLAWRPEFLAHFNHPDVSNRPTENLNLKIKNTKRKARGFRNFTNYRLRILLNHGRIRQDRLTSRIRTRRPSFVA